MSNTAPPRAHTGLLPAFAFPVATFVFFAFGIGPNIGLALLASVVLLVGLVLLWRPGEPPIILFIFLYQWLQCSIAIFYANWKEIPLDQLMTHIGAHDESAMLCLLGLLVLGFGLRIGAGRQILRFYGDTLAIALATPYSTYVKVFISVWIFAAGCDLVAVAFPAASQLLLALASFKWSAFILLTYATFVRPDGNYAIWAGVFMVEFASALGGYFSSFREVFLYTLIALGAAQFRTSTRQALLGAILIGALLYVSVIWTAIKVDYRAFVRGDQSAQVVSVDYATAISKAVELASDVDGTKIETGIDALFKRIMYTEFFGAALIYVPHVVPHQYGALWGDALIRPVTPRILFSDKAIIDESLLTNAYTGLGVSGMEQGTQITIGYMGEAYIDFGYWGMFLPILAVGAAMGRIYHWILTGPRSFGLAGLGLAPPVLMAAAFLEMSSAKLIGGLFAHTLAVWIVIAFVLPRFKLSALPQRNKH